MSCMYVCSHLYKFVQGLPPGLTHQINRVTGYWRQANRVIYPVYPAQWIADLNLDHLSRLGCDKTI